MAKKKRVKKTAKKRKAKVSKAKAVRSSKRKIGIVWKNLVLFAVLTLASLLLYYFSNNQLMRNLFQLLAMILGFVGVAFLIVFLALLIMRLMKK